MPPQLKIRFSQPLFTRKGFFGLQILWNFIPEKVQNIFGIYNKRNKKSLEGTISFIMRCLFARLHTKIRNITIDNLCGGLTTTLLTTIFRPIFKTGVVSHHTISITKSLWPSFWPLSSKITFWFFTVQIPSEHR